jgi:hypothetical protein
MKLDGATFLLQWATGGLAFCWVTTRGREVGIGYGWLLRSIYLLLGAGGLGILLARGVDNAAYWDAAHWIALLATVGVVFGALAALIASIRHRTLETFDPRWDLVAPVCGGVALLAAAEFVGGSVAVAAARLLVGAAFLGCISDAMLLGHWYLVQPGLRRDPVKELVRWNARLWPIEVAVLLLPTGMVSVLSGSVDDGYNGLLGWVWVACAITTIGLIAATWLALRERYYSAVMSATGLLYLAILTAFGTDLVARATLS